MFESADKDTPREAKVLRMRFGIDMNTDHTFKEVGKQFDVARERIRQMRPRPCASCATRAGRRRCGASSISSNRCSFPDAVIPAKAGIQKPRLAGLFLWHLKSRHNRANQSLLVKSRTFWRDNGAIQGAHMSLQLLPDSILRTISQSEDGLALEALQATFPDVARRTLQRHLA